MLAALRQATRTRRATRRPGLDRLGELVEATRPRGCRRHRSVRAPVALPAAVDLAAYRIVQESLTNVARHAPGAPVTIRIIYQPHAVLLEVLDDGHVMTIGRARGARLSRSVWAAGLPACESELRPWAVV